MPLVLPHLSLTLVCIKSHSCARCLLSVRNFAITAFKYASHAQVFCAILFLLLNPYPSVANDQGEGNTNEIRTWISFIGNFGSKIFCLLLFLFSPGLVQILIPKLHFLFQKSLYFNNRWVTNSSQSIGWCLGDARGARNSNSSLSFHLTNLTSPLFTALFPTFQKPLFPETQTLFSKNTEP